MFKQASKDIPGIDTESAHFLARIADLEKARTNHIPGVRTILFVLSSAGMIYDTESLKQKALASYPDATVFFQTTDGKPIGAGCPDMVDLLIDLTGPGQRQALFQAKKLRRMTRVAVGRNSGLFRSRLYDRVLNENGTVRDEGLAQKQVLELAGVVLGLSGDCGPDRGKVVPRELPPMLQL